MKNEYIDIATENGLLHGIWTNTPQARASILLLHGAGAGMEHSFMCEMANLLCEQGFSVLRINFPYIDRGKKLPGSPKENQESIRIAYNYLLNDLHQKRIFVAGKSYGGRMASHVAVDGGLSDCLGLVYFGFPLHAPGKPGKKRADHLQNIKIPQIFLQGENDALAKLDLLREVINPIDQVTLKAYSYANHSFSIPKRISKENLLPKIAQDTANWIDKVL